MLVNASVLNLVHLVKFRLEENELSGQWAVSIKHAFLEFFESVHYLEEVLLPQEVLEVLQLSLLYNGLHWNEQSILLEVLAQIVRLVLLQVVQLA